MLLEGMNSIVAALTALLAVWLVADRMRTNTKRRLHELEVSRKLLEGHAARMEAILNAADVPDVLKARLVQFSDLMAQRSYVERFSGLIAPHVPAPGVPGRYVADDDEDIANLPEEIRSVYYLAFVSGAFGAILRWPECARNLREGIFEQVTSGVFDRADEASPPLAKWIAEAWQRPMAEAA